MATPQIPEASPPRCMYVIYDRVSLAMIGGIVIERHPAPACRLFSQLLADKSTSLSQHPKDFDLRFVGYIEDDGSVVGAEVSTVMTGESWVTMQEVSSNGAE